MNQAKVHRRDVVVDGDGIATVSVLLEDVRLDEPLVLATVSPPFSGVDFALSALTSDGDLDVEPDETGRGTQVAAVRAQPGAPTLKWVKWSFRLSNAYPFTHRDALIPRKSFYQNGPDRHGGRAPVLRISSDKLIQSVKFDSEEAVFRSEDVAVLVQKSDARWHRVGATWKNQMPPPVHVDAKGDNTLYVEFDAPKVGWRYAITFQPREAKEHAQEAREWHTALTITRDVLSARARADDKAARLQLDLLLGLEEQLQHLYETELEPDGWTATGFLWDSDAHRLRTAFGRFPPDHWGVEFQYGQGVAGHAFRFGRQATFDSTRNATLIFQKRSTHSQDWVVCVPLEFNSTCIGVVSFSGRKSPKDTIGTQLFQLASLRAPTSRKTPTPASAAADALDDHGILGLLTWRVNCAFWNALALSDLLPYGSRRMASEVVAALQKSAAGSALPRVSSKSFLVESDAAALTAHAGIEPAAVAQTAFERVRMQLAARQDGVCPKCPDGKLKVSDELVEERDWLVRSWSCVCGYSDAASGVPIHLWPTSSQDRWYVKAARRRAKDALIRCPNCGNESIQATETPVAGIGTSSHVDLSCTTASCDFAKRKVQRSLYGTLVANSRVAALLIVVLTCAALASWVKDRFRPEPKQAEVPQRTVSGSQPTPASSR